jgi:hypothetical protein
VLSLFGHRREIAVITALPVGRHAHTSNRARGHRVSVGDQPEIDVDDLTELADRLLDSQ